MTKRNGRIRRRPVSVTIIVLLILSCSSKEQRFFEAVKVGQADKIQALLDGDLDVNVRNGEGHTALQWAIQHGKADTAKLLLARGAGRDGLSGAELAPMMLYAITVPDLELAEHLIRAGADVNAENEKGQTALGLAAYEASTQIVEALLSAGADVEARDRRGATALMRAAIGGHLETVRLLLERGADIAAADSLGQTVLMYAARGSGQKQGPVVRVLLKSGSDINAGGGSGGGTALIHATRAGNPHSAAVLLSEGADVNHVDEYGRTALMIAAPGDSSMVELLLKAGARVDMKDEDGRTALMHAVTEPENSAAVEALLKAHPDLTLKDKEGKTALELAREEGFPSAASRLEKAGAR
ncbi:MAG TPA: ankyrin repeat domain-containing protein [Spirochaetia bacterium]|nr:ankyrin repeat domain-containing protein [Spirochaetia bacterium]